MPVIAPAAKNAQIPEITGRLTHDQEHYGFDGVPAGSASTVTEVVNGASHSVSVVAARQSRTFLVPPPAALAPAR